MSIYRREIFTCPSQSYHRPLDEETTSIIQFHRSLPGYSSTPMRELPELAREIGVKRILIKDESSRLGLPSFKILGASWGAFRAVVKKLGLDLNASLETAKDSLSKTPLTLFAATDGNHGQAVAYMASLLGIHSSIFVPVSLDRHVKDAITARGGTVFEVDGDYDSAVKFASQRAAIENGILVQDTSWEGYEDVPSWIVQGYSTMFVEMFEQTPDLSTEDLMVITPVGVGSLAHAVVDGFRSRAATVKIVTVEPDSAACLYRNRRAGKLFPISTSHTIMTGMDCGSVTLTAFADLQKYTDMNLTISDYEAHQAVQHLTTEGVNSGPCGAAGVAATRRLAQAGHLTSNQTVILINTESTRQYAEPMDVSIDDPVALTQKLVHIESTNTTLSKDSGSGEKCIIDYIEAWLQHRDIETHRLAEDKHRPSLVGIVRGTGSGKSLMINGHIDTVTLAGYASDPLGGTIEMRDGEEAVTGRGALDMKAGVAIGMCNLTRAKGKQLKGDVMLVAVADEEDASKGTVEVLAAGWKADAAIIPEPTQQEILVAHKGFLWIEITVHGIAAHGSDAGTGVDAIMSMRYLLDELQRYADLLPCDPVLGQATLHCGTIRGGEENSSYAAACSLTTEFRTIPGQSSTSIVNDLSTILKNISSKHLEFRHSQPRTLFERPFHALPTDHSLTKHFASLAETVSGKTHKVGSGAFWCDAALLGEKGIPALIFGPSGQGLHGKDEYVTTSSIKDVDAVIDNFISEFCG